MKTTRTLICILLLLVLINKSSFAQSNKEKALDKGRQALSLEQEGKFDDAIKLLQESMKLDPDDINYPYELAYAYYSIKDYKKSCKYLEDIIDHKDVTDLVYQLLGNCYDNLGKSEKAIKIYEDGLNKFPNSGSLCLEMGIMQMGKKDYNKAIYYYEKGIEVAPTFPSNYYWAAKLYCNSTEEVWGMIYGEIFMNLERNTKRTSEISKLLFDTYKSQITISGDTSASVSFSKNSTMNISDLSDPSNIRLPFGMMAYEPGLIMSIIGIKSIDINSLDTIRSNFVDIYFKNGNDKKYPNVLFSYQKEIKDLGHMEAYNHWVLMKGDEEAFSTWQKDNQSKWETFVKWFRENPIKITNENKFYRGQY